MAAQPAGAAPAAQPSGAAPAAQPSAVAIPAALGQTVPQTPPLLPGVSRPKLKANSETPNPKPYIRYGEGGRMAAGSWWAAQPPRRGGPRLRTIGPSSRALITYSGFRV